LQSANDIQKCIDIVYKLSDANKNTCIFLVQFLQHLCKPEISERTKVNSESLSSLFAPSFFGEISITADAASLTNLELERQFVRTLIENLNHPEQLWKLS